MNAVVERSIHRAKMAVLWASRGAAGLVAPPRTAQVEITNRCNLACRTCTRMKLPQLGDMSYADFCSVIDSLGRVGRLWLSGQGEPLLHRDLPKMIRYCADRGITQTVVHTSGMLLCGEIAEALAESGLGELRVSIDGGNAEEVEYLRQGASLDRILDNTEAFVRLGTVQTGFYTILNRRNYISAPLLPELAARVGVRQIWMVETVPFRDESTEREIYDRREYQFASLGKEVRRATIEKTRENAERHGVDVSIDLKWHRKRCFEPFQKIYIDFQGNVTPCCRIHNEVFVGNILTDGLSGSWYSRLMQQWRKDLLRRDRHRRICVERCNLGIGDQSLEDR